MNEIDMLRRLRSEVSEPGGPALDAAEARFVAAMVADHSRVGGLGRLRRLALLGGAGTAPAWLPRPALRVAVPLGLAAVLAIGVTVATTGGDPAGTGSGDRVAGGTASDGGSAAGDVAGMVPVSAVQLLDRAAYVAEKEPAAGEIAPRADQFIVYESTTMYQSLGFGAKETRYLYRTNRKIWLSADGTRDGLLRIENLEPKAYPGWPLPEQARADVGTVDWHRLPVCGRIPDELRRDYVALSKLPTDPAGMLRYLRSGYQPKEGRQADDVAWTAVGDMLREAYPPAAQRAALFRAASMISGVTLVQDAEDAAGRKGIAVARVDKGTGSRVEIIFDPTTYRYLGEREIVVDAAAAKAPVGSLLASTAQRSVTVADSVPNQADTGPKPETCEPETKPTK